MNEVEEIKERLNIVDFIGDYIRLSKAGSSYKGLCPFHNERTPSFTVSEERQMFHCFGCQKGGDIFTFLMEMEGMEFRDALEVLADRAGVKVQKTESGNRRMGSTSQIDTKKILEALEWATKFYEKQLWDGMGSQHALPYLEKRGMHEDILRRFRIGFAPEGWDHVLIFLQDKKYTLQEIEATGLLVKKENGRMYDRFRSRIMFPITDIMGRVVGYSARTLPGSDEKGAKYINTPETDVYHKSRVAYGLSHAKESIKQNKQAIVVEGNMDVLAMHQMGFENTVAVSGTALTPEHIKLLKRYAQTIVFFFDSDDAGQDAAKKSVFLANAQEISSSIITLSGGKDAAEMAQGHPDELREAIANTTNSMEYFFDIWKRECDLKSVEGKKEYARRALEMIGTIQNEVEISHWMARIADILSVEIDAFYTMLRREQRRDQRYTHADEEEQQNTQKVAEVSQKGSRFELISDRIVGLFFISPSVWQRYALLAEEREVLREARETFLYRVFVYGRNSDYDFDRARMLMSEEDRVRAENIAFGEESALLKEKTMTEAELEAEVERLLESMKKEGLKEKIRAIEREIREAEQAKDTQEVRNLSAKLHQLMTFIHT